MDGWQKGEGVKDEGIFVRRLALSRNICGMNIFLVELTLRYTRISCMPFRASLEFGRYIQATDKSDALRQSCLCVDRDLEDILARVNTMNVTKVVVEPRNIRRINGQSPEPIWNHEPFDHNIKIPRYIVLNH